MTGLAPGKRGKGVPKQKFAKAAQLMQKDFLDPEDIWSDVSALPTFSVPAIVACAEMSFARIAVMIYLVERYLPPTSDRSGLMDALGAMMEAEFAGHGSDLIYDRPLAGVAREATAIYAKSAENPVLITGLLLRRLKCDGAAPADYAYLLERFGNTFCAKALKVWPKSY